MFRARHPGTGGGRGQAAVSLPAHIAKKAASTLSERELVNQALAPSEPGPGQVRLHFAGDKSSRTWRSRQEGLHLLAQGAFAGIRNVATHTGDEWPEQVALEHLAILSVVARWDENADEILRRVFDDHCMLVALSSRGAPVSAESPEKSGADPLVSRPHGFS